MADPINRLEQFENIFGVKLARTPDKEERSILADVVKKEIERRSSSLETRQVQLAEALAQRPTSAEAAGAALSNLARTRENLTYDEADPKIALDVAKGLEFDDSNWEVIILSEPADAVATVS